MSKISCDVAKDLIPLYIDNVLSEESTDVVKEHVSNCKKCQATLEKMDANIDKINELKDKDAKLFKRLKKGFKKKYIWRAIVIAAVVILLWLGLSIYVMFHVNPIWPNASEEGIKENVEVVSIDGTLFLHHKDTYGRGDIFFVDMMAADLDKGVVNLYLGEIGIRNLGLGGSWIEGDRYQRILSDDNPMKIKVINYCNPDGTIITTLWEEGDEVPELNQ